MPLARGAELAEFGMAMKKARAIRSERVIVSSCFGAWAGRPQLQKGTN
jgi:hypothetical protein